MTDKYDEMAREIIVGWFAMGISHTDALTADIVSALRQVAQEKERETVERAAKVCEEIEDEFRSIDAQHRAAGARACTKAIRSLSTTRLVEVRLPKLGEPVFDMRVTNITRQEAREIAELLGGGAVLWQHDKCYPTMDVMCELRPTSPTPTEDVSTPGDGYVRVPREPTDKMISAMACSEARDDEGDFPALLDLIDFSGENKTHTVLRAAYRAMIQAAEKGE